MNQSADVAVIGLGAMGAATLYQLARRNVRVLGIDRFVPPHALGSSHGETRLTRQAVGEGAAYVPFVLRSHVIWRELESATGTTLFNACGGVLIASLSQSSSHHGRRDFIRVTEALARQFAIPHEMLDRDTLTRRFPQFTGLAADAVAYYEPGAGFLHPEVCIAAQLGEARRLGARILTDIQVTAVSESDGRVRLATKDGLIEASHAIVAAGAWTAPLLGPPFDGLLRVTRQVLHWFVPNDPNLFSCERCPVFLDMWGPGDCDYFYGFPIPNRATGVKVATEQYAVATDADHADRAAGPEEAARMHATHVAGRLAGVTTRALRSVACLYTNTPDAGFLIDTHPAMPRVLVVSACSGHGFKHSAAIGEAVAEQITSDRSTLDLSAFRLGRLAEERI